MHDLSAWLLIADTRLVYIWVLCLSPPWIQRWTARARTVATVGWRAGASSREREGDCTIDRIAATGRWLVVKNNNELEFIHFPKRLVPNHAVYQMPDVSIPGIVHPCNRNHRAPRTAIAHSTSCESFLAPFIARIAVSSLLIFHSSTPPSPRPLKVATATHNSHTLVHDRLADPKVAVDPLSDAGGFGNGV
jgi:hypothetical protein